MKLTAQAWHAVLAKCGVKPSQLAVWPSVFAHTLTDDSFSKGPSELPPFLGNVLHESGRLARMLENLNYSAERIRAVAHTAKPGTRWHRAGQMADDLAGKPEALAEVLYGGRFGNSRPGDGILYCGRSPIMITFHDNYMRLSELVGQDLCSNPHLLEQPHYALEITLAWWEDKVPDEYIGNDALVRRVVQGGKLGLEDVTRLTALAGQALAEYAA